MKKKLAAILLAALLVCAPVGAADEELKDTYETEVSIGFTGAVYFVEMESGGMDIDFGAHMLPVRGVVAQLTASDGEHTLRVCDRRATPGKWSVSAIMTTFASGGDSFSIEMYLDNPTATTGLTPNLIGVAPNQLVAINTGLRKFMDAAATLTPGEYDLTTTAEKIRLYIPVAEVAKIKPLAYSSTITWTLTLTP